tara:strand:+ start:3767 stop:4606 length:840 start_codon:yes stop_codon:yes gene_type:complete
VKRILLTGGNGQLAKEIELKFKDIYDLVSLSKKDLDITDRNSVKSVLVNYKPDIVINAAAYTDVDACEINSDLAYNINAHSIEHFAKFFRGLFVQISTDYVFDGQNGPYNENSKTNPLGIYGKSKFLGEKNVKKLFNNYLIIRTNVLFGGNSKASFLNWIVQSLLAKKTIYVVEDQINNPVSIFDISHIIKLLLIQKKTGLFHVGSDQLCSRFDFANMIAEVWNLEKKYIKPISTNQLKKKVKNYVAERPLRSGLMSAKKEIPNFSLEDSLIKIKLQNE